MDEIKVWIVRRKNKESGRMEAISAWPDVYDAKFEADRWEQDSKIPHDYIPGSLAPWEEPDVDH